MNVAELFDLTRWIDNEIKAKQIRLIEAISAVPLESLSAQQVDFLRKLGIGDHVGQDAVRKIEDILFRTPLDPATAAQRFAEIIRAIDEGIQKSDQLQQTLKGLVPPEPELEEKVLVRVTFSNDAAIANVVDLKSWSEVWYDIGRGIAMINDASPEEIRIVGAGKGSVVLELAVANGIGKTIASVILEALKVAEKVMDVRKKAEEVKNLKLTNSKIAKELADAADIEKKKGIESITEAVAGMKRKKDGAEGDKVVAFDHAVSKLVDL